MKSINALTYEQANSTTQTVFDGIKKQLGKVPNLYAAMGHSDKLLTSFLDASDQLKRGFFTAKQYEAIALATSQANGCEYCQAAHTMLAQMQGYDEATTIAIRKNEVDDPQLKALLNVTYELIQLNGAVQATTLNGFYLQGFNQTAFVELLGIVSLVTITNRLYQNGDFEIDFPLAPDLDQHSQLA